jgi:hypothetical protein
MVEDSFKPKAPSSRDASCDGKDNDCDGVNDEDYVNVGTSCGKGECSSTGTKSCVAGNEVDSCKAGTPKPEVCDGKDNDCDGLTDEGMTDNNNNGICNELDCTVNEPLDKYLVLNCYTDPSLTAKMSVDACWGDLTSVGTLPGEMAYIGLDYFDVGTDFNGAGIKLCVHPLWTDCENNEPLPIACDHEIAFETKLFGTQYIWNLISPKPDDYQAEFHFDQTKNPDVASIQIFIFNNNAGCNYLYNAFSCN